MSSNQDPVTPPGMNFDLASLCFNWLDPSMRHGNKPDLQLGLSTSIVAIDPGFSLEATPNANSSIVVRVVEGELIVTALDDPSDKGWYKTYLGDGEFEEKQLTLEPQTISEDGWFRVDGLRHKLETGTEGATIAMHQIEPESPDDGTIVCRPCPTYPM